MQLIAGLSPVPEACRRGVAAVGNFDGVHRGHQTLLAQAAAEGARLGLPWGVVSFEPHPRSFFRPDEPVFRLTPGPLKARLVAALGASFLAVLDFDRALSELPPEDFVRLHLVERLAVKHVVMGYDFHFGKGRKGSPATMTELGAKFGFGVTIVEQVTDEGGQHSPFSSSNIRQALRHGHVETAARELGYRWSVLGEVVKGDQRGRTIGFPTLNIVLDKGADPYRGIYAVRVRDAQTPAAPVWQGAGYFGNRPTFDTGRTFLEVYLIGFEGDLYGRQLFVEFIDLIRGDKRFASIDELVTQMKMDCDAAVKRLSAPDDAMLAFPLGRLQAEGKI
ncbi:MAG: bifunctional riboflavin kinase/FAD synthetase [Aestuariivirga sp.]|uniref:bifunctional riboflavin kinase/FAD synthetase n=1 Tax=Aestuariivirga sp. TaxID=2650926 RepID=UPI0025BD883C|nr:bifunctional riboflavin kinase/FAD synthetase [Aestuariivirga sp.]MCA3560775.1 bifunctional riboflavin kinase/FAD synthetase [Aestuariivirga sp.]